MSETDGRLPPLMPPERARDMARSLAALSHQYAELGMPRQAATALQESQWWLTYAIALQQIPPTEAAS